MADTVFTQVDNFIKQAQGYATTSIDQALVDISDSITKANDIKLIEFTPNPTNNYIIKDILTQPFSKTDIPDIDSMLSLTTVDPYTKEWLAKFNLIMDNYFNDLLSFHLGEKALEDILQNGYIINVNIHNQIIGRAIDSENFKYKENKENITTEFLSKGWTIPNFMILNRLDKAHQEYSQNTSQVIRDISIKEEELNNEMYKFAIQQSVDLLPKCIEIASNFSGKYAQVYAFGIQAAQAYIQGLGVVSQSVANYENEVNARLKLGLDEVIDWRHYDLDSKYKQAEFNLQKVELNTKTTISGVDALTRIGVAGLQAQQSIVNLSSAGVTTYAGQTAV